MILAWLLLLTGLTISSVAIYYSVVGLTAIFSAAAIPIMIMGVSLEVAKLVCATWIKQYWTQVPRLMKTYMVTAVVLLMLITSMGIFGFLSKAHNDQNLVSGDVGAKLAIYDEKIKTARDNIDANRKQLQQMDAAVDQVMSRSSDEKGADKAVAIRNNQKRDRAAIAKDIESNQKIISQLNDEAAPIRAENRKVEAEVGPIKYIAAFIYGVAPDATMLEKAVTWIIITIVIVFDPLAVIMLLAAQMTFAWLRGVKPAVEEKDTKEPESTVFTQFAKKIRRKLYKDDTPDFEGVKLPDGNWVQTGPAFNTPETKEEYVNVDDVNAMLADATEPVEHIEEPKEELLVIEEPKEIDKPLEDYVEPTPPPPPPILEAAPGLNRGVMYSAPIQADNAPALGRSSNSDFGNEFPPSPLKGDVYVRIDYLPNKLFKYNGSKWIEVDKSYTDVYAYNDLYIKHLIEQIDAGSYDPDSLTDVEREQIADYLGKNAQ